MIVQFERDTKRVEPGAEVGGGCGHANSDRRLSHRETILQTMRSKFKVQSSTLFKKDCRLA